MILKNNNNKINNFFEKNNEKMTLKILMNEIRVF